MNFLDVIILIIMLGFTIRSFFNGFVKEAFGLGGMILGIVAANTFYVSVASILNSYIKAMFIANILAFILIVVLVTILVILIGRVIIKSIEMVKLKWADKILGIAFGLAKGLIVVSLLVMFLAAVLPNDITFMADSRLLPEIQSIYKSFLDVGY